MIRAVQGPRLTDSKDSQTFRTDTYLTLYTLVLSDFAGSDTVQKDSPTTPDK